MVSIGDRLGDYSITGRIAAGGMATLFIGQRSGAAGFALPVALKVLHNELADDPELVRMFVEEALLSARIRHPNVVRVEQLLNVQGRYCLVMEYVPGCSLAQLLRALSRRGRKLAPELAIAIAMHVADGLHAAHETTGDGGEALGVVHRDVSPQNVLLTDGGHVKLIDFGVAKVRSRGRSRSGSLRGKLAYMAPEQALRQPVDRRTDVYALGIVLWEMLTMQRLFDAVDEIDLLEQIRAPSIVPPGARGALVGTAVDAAVMRALATDPDRRPETALQFRRMLAEAEPRALAFEASQLAAVIAGFARGDPHDGSDAQATLDGLTLAHDPPTPTDAGFAQDEVMSRPVDTAAAAAPAASVHRASWRTRAGAVMATLAAVGLVAAGTLGIARWHHAHEVVAPSASASSTMRANEMTAAIPAMAGPTATRDAGASMPPSNDALARTSPQGPSTHALPRGLSAMPSRFAGSASSTPGVLPVVPSIRPPRTRRRHTTTRARANGTAPIVEHFAY